MIRVISPRYLFFPDFLRARPLQTAACHYQKLPLSGSEIRSGLFSQKQFDYVIVGDATTVAGLAAPYNEEETSHIWKIERAPDQSTMLDFWMEHGNTDHFSGKTPEMQQFKDG